MKTPTVEPEAYGSPAFSSVLLAGLFPPKAIDRRRWPRRASAPIRVFVAHAESGRLWQGCVLDSSLGGLGLKLMGPLPPGRAVLTVSRCSVPALEASVRVCVVHGRQEHNCCVIGCEFVENPLPSVRVLFS